MAAFTSIHFYGWKVEFFETVRTVLKCRPFNRRRSTWRAPVNDDRTEIWKKLAQIRIEKNEENLSKGDHPGWKWDDHVNGNWKEVLITISTLIICSNITWRQNIFICRGNFISRWQEGWVQYCLYLLGMSNQSVRCPIL